jgi:hypothetical protein
MLLMTDHELVKTCMRRVLKKLGFDDADAIGQRSLEYLCDQVHDKTGVLLSLSTAKRLLNGQFNKLPQSATLNAIAQFLGYADWQQYKQQQQSISENIQQDLLPGTKEETTVPFTTKKNYKRLSWIALVLIAGVTLMLIAFLKRAPAKTGSGKALFSAEKTTANNIPNTVVFHYNVDDIDADSFFIQQSWDKNRRVRVYKKQYTLTDIYYEPGYHVAKLIANDKIIKTFDVSIPTNKCFFYAKEKTRGSLPEYIEKPGTNGDLSITKEDIVSNKIDTRNEKQYISVFFPAHFEISSDDFVFKARIKRTGLRNDFCPMLMLEVFCQRNFMFMQSMKPGCSSNAITQFGENFLDGKTHDLSCLTTTIDEWHDYEILVKNHSVNISIDNKKVFETTYKQSSGMITGLGFISNGLCQIAMADLNGGDGKVFYSFKKG